jgi:nucleotide-binding universal stress UspA family protein
MKEKIPASGKPLKLAVGRILVPVDFSEYSKDALQYAADLGRHFNAQLLLVYVVESVGYPADLGSGQVDIPKIERELSDRALEELDRLASKYSDEHLKISTLVHTGRPFVEILRAAKEFGIDLIVIATHGHTGVEHMLFGSTAEKVVRKAPCPVLVVR